MLERRPELAGKPFQPTDRNVASMFEESFCGMCLKDQLYRQGKGEGCEILMLAFLFELGDAAYPTEWVHDKEGSPTCTAFEPIAADGGT